MAGLAQRPDHRPRATLVGHQFHVLRFRRAGSIAKQHHFLVRHARRPIGDRRPDVLGLQMRVVVEELGLARPLGQLAQDQLDRDRVPRITGLPIITAGLISMRSVVIAVPRSPMIAPAAQLRQRGLARRRARFRPCACPETFGQSFEGRRVSARSNRPSRRPRWPQPPGVPCSSTKLQSLAYCTRPSLRATARDAAWVREVLYRGIRPDARIAQAHAAVTRAATPRPRKAGAVSTPPRPPALNSSSRKSKR